VEGSDTMAKVARKVIDANGYNQTVNLHNKFSTSLKIGSDMPLVLCVLMFYSKCVRMVS
jgi:hypothetical protein